MATIMVTPNQSMADVIIQAMGSLEGGMAFCALNNVAISDTPVVGTIYVIPDGTQNTFLPFDSSMPDSGTLTYLRQNGIIIGTLGATVGTFITEDGSEEFATEDGLDAFIPEH